MWRRWALTFGALASGMSPVGAQEGPTRVVDASLPIGEITQEAAEAQRERILEFRPWRRNYFLATRDLRDPQNDTEAKFQVSIRSRLADWGPEEHEWSVDFAYTGHFLWRALTRDPGEAYFTADHLPEIFVETPVLDHHWLVRVSPFLHHSNGEAGADSRGWNRAYIDVVWHSHVDPESPMFFFDPEAGAGCRFGLRWWRPYGVEDENSDIEDYYGNIELRADLYRNSWARSVLSLVYRDSTLIADEPRHTLQLDYGFDLTEDIRLSFQYFTGYGDVISRYDEHVQRVGFGIEIAP